MQILDAILLGCIEGITEFIPISSTGHLIIAGSFLRLQGLKISTFEIFIQLGAILAVVFLYRTRVKSLISFKKTNGFSGFNGLLLLALTTIPALILGFFSHHFIKEKLFNPMTVALGLGLGGAGLIVLEQFHLRANKNNLDDICRNHALLIGLFQCLSLWPGMSRSACTIAGAMILGIERKTAAEYSFLAAVPVMTAAVSYDLYKNISLLQTSDLVIFGIGFAAAFMTAYLSIKFFIKLLSRWTLAPFGWYRLCIAPLTYFYFHQYL